MKRSPIKNKRVREVWDDAQEKREPCRVCGAWPVELAHTIGKEKQNALKLGPRGGMYSYVPPDAVVPLCNEHHRAFHAHQLDLLPYLDEDEQDNAFWACKRNIAIAYRRLTGSRED